MNQNAALNRFVWMGTVTVLAVYLLIFVGGIVRASGSGMGCPDWPTCFGRLIPPLAENDLPPDYHQRYLGYGDTTFNPLKTWTEYLNRLLGVSIGLLILLSLIRSLPLRKETPWVFRLSLSAFLMVGFQGWLGSRVVASELKPALISAHMVVALLIVITLILAVSAASNALETRGRLRVPDPRWPRVLGIALGLTLLQIAMGTQIREAVDGITLAQMIPERSIWREQFPIIFYVHRSFSSVILFTNLWIVWRLMKTTAPGHPLRRPGLILAGLVVLAIFSGVTLDRLGFPAFAQPVHLLLANLIFGTQLWLYARHRLNQGSPLDRPMTSGVVSAQRP